MNYRHIYDRLIEKYGVWKKPFGVYTERHRKIPGHFGGRYIKGNAFYLSARAHYLCHLLLAKIYGGRMWKPITLMGYSLGKTRSKFYELSRKEHSEWMKENAPCKNPETAKRHSIWMTGNNNPAKRLIVREKMSRSSKGKPKSTEHKANIAAAYKNLEVRKKQLSQIHSSYKCSECGLVGNAGNISQHLKRTNHSSTEKV